MSSHCGRYPKCLCPESYGNKCHLSEEEYISKGVDEGKRLIDGLLLEASKREMELKYTPRETFGKQRNQMKHLTPKKKKRK
jgi:hypothetical protein